MEGAPENRWKTGGRNFTTVSGGAVDIHPENRLITGWPFLLLSVD